MEIVRFLDREKLGTIDISHECQRFLERITVLVKGEWWMVEMVLEVGGWVDWGAGGDGGGIRDISK